MTEKMTMRELLTYFEEFYGEIYSGVFRATMADYLNGYSGDFYKAAAKVLVKRYSRSWNKAPGPAEFEKNMDEILAAMPKPELLPEPKYEPTDEDRAEVSRMMAEFRQTLNKPGPMAAILSKTFEELKYE